jgi:predicted O-methyltransferase YrrM
MDIRQVVEYSTASQNHDELFELLVKVKKSEPKVILEIGVHLGYSLQDWRRAFEPDILIGVDNDTSKLRFDDADIIEGDSHSVDTWDEVKLALAGSKVDFLFIDGDHTYEGVKQDYEMYGPLVKKGGVIALHDAGIADNPGVEVYKLWDELADQGVNGELIYNKSSTGVALIYV